MKANCKESDKIERRNCPAFYDSREREWFVHFGGDVMPLLELLGAIKFAHENNYTCVDRVDDLRLAHREPDSDNWIVNSDPHPIPLKTLFDLIAEGARHIARMDESFAPEKGSETLH